MDVYTCLTDYKILRMIYRANEGMWLTQKKDVTIDNRVLAKEVACSAKMFEKNWHEITDARKKEYDAEYEAWLHEQEENNGDQ